jgi:cadmium resistance protein CadD (predicted permease)
MTDNVFLAAVQGVLAFVATNLDDLAVLVAYLASGRVTRGQAVAGQVVGMGLVLALSAAVAFGAGWVPVEWLRWIGLLPLAIGIKQLGQALLRWRRGTDSTSPAISPDSTPLGGGGPWSGIATIALLVLANGGDNASVYTALFAGQSWMLSSVQIAAALILAGVWVGLAAWLVGHHTMGAPVRPVAPWILPWILIGLGVWILAG